MNATATITIDFSNKLRPDEGLALLDESMRRGVPVDVIVVEALRLRRQHQPQPPAGLLSAPDVEAAQAA